LDDVTVSNCLKFRFYALQYDLQDALKAARNVIKENFLEVVKLDDFLKLDLNDVSEIISGKQKNVIIKKNLYLR